MGRKWKIFPSLSCFEISARDILWKLVDVFSGESMSQWCYWCNDIWAMGKGCTEWGEVGSFLVTKQFHYLTRVAGFTHLFWQQVVVEFNSWERCTMLFGAFTNEHFRGNHVGLEEEFDRITSITSSFKVQESWIATKRKIKKLSSFVGSAENFV